MNQELEYCMVCGEENPPDREICKCGGRNFVFGHGFTFRNKQVNCNCDNDKFILKFRLNRSPIHDKTYICSKCNNKIGIQTYCEGYF